MRIIMLRSYHQNQINIKAYPQISQIAQIEFKQQGYVLRLNQCNLCNLRTTPDFLCGKHLHYRSFPE